MQPILIDKEPGGVIHLVVFDGIKTEHPDGKSGMVDILTMLAHHNEHPEDREKGGWNIVNQLPGEERPLTRWERLVAAANHPDAHPLLKGLKLRGNTVEST